MPSIYFSVILRVFNLEEYLDRAILSVVSQDYSNFELIAVDDCSTDGTAAILDSWAEKDSRIRVIHKPKNEGASLGFKTGIEESRGDYLVFIDADDCYLPGFLSKLVEEIEAGAYDLLMTDNINTYPNSSRSRVIRYYRPGGILRGYELLEEVCNFSLNTMMNSKAVSRAFVEKLQYYKRFWSSEDTIMLLQIALKRPLVKHIPFISYNYLQRSSSASHRLVSAEYIVDWCSEVKNLVNSAEGLSELQKELYPGLSAIKLYYSYISHSRNPWKGDMDFAVSLRNLIRKHKDAVLEYNDPFYIKAILIDEYRFLRPYLLFLFMLRRWRNSLQKRIVKQR